jgi:hypothetical protein
LCLRTASYCVWGTIARSNLIGLNRNRYNVQLAFATLCSTGRPRSHMLGSSPHQKGWIGVRSKLAFKNRSVPTPSRLGDHQSRMKPSQMFYEVLPFVLQHSLVPAIGQLLCCSKATAAAVHTNLVGTFQLDLACKSVHQKHILAWISKHASLLCSMHHNYGFHINREDSSTESAEDEAADRLAAALAKAAALPGGLKLQSLQTFSLSVLRAASCRTLTCLHLCLDKDMLFPSVQETAAAITGEHIAAGDVFMPAVLPMSCTCGCMCLRRTPVVGPYFTCSRCCHCQGPPAHSMLRHQLPSIIWWGA